jgi:uncharacterized lipoprotein YajG
MKRLGLPLLGLFLLAGCTTASTTTSTAPPPKTVVAPAQPSQTGRYSGLVWTWDAERNIVTFYSMDQARTFRVLTTPDQIARLRKDENATVTGQLLAPDDLSNVVVPASR